MVFYKHQGKDFVNLNEVVREKLENLPNEDSIYELADNLKNNDFDKYIDFLKFMAHDAHVYLCYSDNHNDLMPNDRLIFEQLNNISDSLYEAFILEQDEEIIDYAVFFIKSNPLFRTRCILELTEEENELLISRNVMHLLDIQSYKEDLSVERLIDYFKYMRRVDIENLFSNQMIVTDITQFLNYLCAEYTYSFENIMNGINEKIYKWNKYLFDHEVDSELGEFVNILETYNGLELGEIALENSNIMSEMLFQLLEYEETKKEVIQDGEGNLITINEAEVDDYMKKYKK